MLSMLHDKHSQCTDGYLRSTASISPADPGQNNSLLLDLQNTFGRLESHKQAPTPAKAHFAPANHSADFTKAKPAGTNSKRVCVQRDRNRMKCSRCIMHKRGCDGEQPQCANCWKVKKTCEWVEPGVTRKDVESRIADGTMSSPGTRPIVITTRVIDRRRRADDWTSPGHDEYEGHLSKIQEEMEDVDAENLFDKTTKLYKDYNLADGTIADKWAREFNSTLQLNWHEHPTELSQYSRGDCGGLGFTSTMERKLGKEPSNQTYLPRKQPDFSRTESVPTQDWEVASIKPIGGFRGVAEPGADLSQTLTVDALYVLGGLRGYGEVEFNREYGVGSFATGVDAGVGVGFGFGFGGPSEDFGLPSQKPMSSQHANIYWTDWVNEEYFHFTKSKD